MAMEDMWRALQVLQQKNNNMRQAFEQLQVGARPTPQNPEVAINRQVLQPAPQREPRVSLLEKDRAQISRKIMRNMKMFNTIIPHITIPLQLKEPLNLSMLLLIFRLHLAILDLVGGNQVGYPSYCYKLQPKLKPLFLTFFEFYQMRQWHSTCGDSPIHLMRATETPILLRKDHDISIS